MTTQEIIMTIIECVVLVIFFLIGKVLIPSIKGTTAEKALDALKEFITVYVRGVEQTTTEQNAGDKKLAEVTELVSTKAKELGVNISETDIQMLIESAVLALNEGEKSTTTVKVENQ